MNTRCQGCYRPGRTYGVPLEAAPGTIALSNGRCRRCKHNGDGNSYASLNSPVDMADFDPHLIAIENNRTLTEMVLFPMPMFSKQYPAECRLCEWAKVAPTPLLARKWAYNHLNTFIERRNP